jgi:hypothetical protein
MNWDDISECDKSSLRQLHFIKILEYSNCLDDFYEKQRRGIKVMLPSFLLSFNIPDHVKIEIEKKAFSMIKFSSIKKNRNKAS